MAPLITPGFEAFATWRPGAGLTSRPLSDVHEELGEVDGAVGLVEALVHRLAALLVELRVDGGEREVARRVAHALADVVIVEQHADHAPVEAGEDLHHDGAHLPARESPVGREIVTKGEHT